MSRQAFEEGFSALQRACPNHVVEALTKLFSDINSLDVGGVIVAYNTIQTVAYSNPQLRKDPVLRGLGGAVIDRMHWLILNDSPRQTTGGRLKDHFYAATGCDFMTPLAINMAKTAMFTCKDVMTPA